MAYPFLPAIQDLLGKLIAGDLDAVVRLTAGVRLSTSDLRGAIKDYGRTLAPHPGSALVEHIDVVEHLNAPPKGWSVQVPLWTQEDGLSDLTLELTVIEEGKKFRIELDNLHVL